MPLITTRRGLLAGSAGLLAAPGLVRAQGAWPNRPIRLVIPFTPAGTTDLVGRLTAERLSQRLGQQVVVENRPGAGGNVAGEHVARSDPDGYTLLFTTIGTGAINFAVYGARMPYKPEDYVGVGLMTRVPNVLMVAKRLPVRSLPELVALAKRDPGKLNYGSSGIGTSPHVCVELLKITTGMDMVHVPYRGSGPMLTELVAERVDVGMDNIPSALPFIRDGKIRAIGVTSTRRTAVLPDVPTLDESGAKGFEATAWFGVLAPARTPRPIVERLGKELDAIGKEADFRRRLGEFGAGPPDLTPDGGSSPETFDRFLKAEVERWADVVRRSGASVD